MMTENTPISFPELLNIVAIVDENNVQVQELLEEIAAAGYEIEVTSGYERDIFDDGEVGAYIVSTDGARKVQAQQFGQAVLATGNAVPGWVLADSPRLSDLADFETIRGVSGFMYLGQQTPAFYAKQVIASVVEYGRSMFPLRFLKMLDYDYEANIAFDCVSHQGRQFYRKSSAGQVDDQYIATISDSSSAPTP